MERQYTEALIILYAWGHELLDLVKELDDFNTFPETKKEALTYMTAYEYSLSKFYFEEAIICQTLRNLNNPNLLSPKRYAAFFQLTEFIYENYNNGVYDAMEQAITIQNQSTALDSISKSSLLS
jgi:hypothetical protein